MSATVAAALKKIAVYILTDKKALKVVGGIILGIIIIIIMPIVALLTCIFIGYVVKTQLVVDEVKSSSKFSREKLFVVVIKYIAPIFIVAILVSSVLSGLGIITI